MSMLSPKIVVAVRMPALRNFLLSGPLAFDEGHTCRAGLFRPGCRVNEACAVRLVREFADLGRAVRKVVRRMR